MPQQKPEARSATRYHFKFINPTPTTELAHSGSGFGCRMLQDGALSCVVTQERAVPMFFAVAGPSATPANCTMYINTTVAAKANGLILVWEYFTGVALQAPQFASSGPRHAGAPP
jgi:hypothetical protein